jgi:hypothetical protein
MNHTDPSPWTARADALAEWAWARLVNRADAWGGYRPLEEVGKEYMRRDGTNGKLGPQTTRKGRLTPAHLARHFRARGREDVIGLHSTSPDNTSLWGALDVDWHGPTSTTPEVNGRAARVWYDRLRSARFRPLLTDSNGQGGYHLRVLFAAPLPTPRVFHFLKSLVRDHGMAKPPETFPKQARVRPRPDGRPGFGNWLRLPGRHHKHDHWSRVWDGSAWLSGAAAVDFVLSLTGDPVHLVPEEPPPPPPPPARRPVCCPRNGAQDNLAARIAAYLRRLPNLGEGQGRDDVAYHFAAFLGRDLALSKDVALDWLVRWDAGNRPPKGEAALCEILDNALRYGRNAIGCARDQAPPARRSCTRHGHSILNCKVEVW